MSIITKQIIINKLPLPDELIDIIKDYVFYNIINKTKKIKKIIMPIVDTIRIPHKTQLIWISKKHAYGNDRAEFCLNCGDYLWSYTCRITIKVICVCDINYTFSHSKLPLSGQNCIAKQMIKNAPVAHLRCDMV